MSTFIYTMTEPAVEPALARRLEALTGEDATCCAAAWRDHADAARAAPAFDAALLRAKALSDERRLVAAMLLKREGEMCGCEIQAALDVTHATVSHHMNCLQTAGLVTSERRGKWTYYRLAPDARAHIP